MSGARPEEQSILSIEEYKKMNNKHVDERTFEQLKP